MIYLARQLKALRRECGYTQEEIAEAAHVSPQSVSKWERGESNPDIELLPVLAYILGTSVDALLGVEEIYDSKRRGAAFARAHELFEAGDYQAAAAVLRERLALIPNDPGLASELAFCLALDGEHLTEAIELCRKILSGHANHKVTHTTRAAMCFMLMLAGDIQGAQEMAAELPHMRESREEVLAALKLAKTNAEIETCLRRIVLGK